MFQPQPIPNEYRAAGLPIEGTQPVIYLAEDDDDIRETLAALFAHDGFLVRAAPDGQHLFDWLFRERGPGMRTPDVIVTDHRMPGYCSLDILDCLAEIKWTIPVIVITAYGAEVRSMARSHGAQAVLEKPFEPDDLRLAAMHCVNWRTRKLRPRIDSSSGHAMSRRAREAMRTATEELEPQEDR
ncbi:MAG: response regulator [Myxococcales bacterium]|nr:response regulator [Myxococcales bacterium]MCB9717132.1 response regulator [Myxococcales bacterium]